MANSLNSIMGMIKAQGLFSPGVQRVLHHHCDAGRIAEVADLVVQALLEDGVSKRELPIPRGVLTPEIRDLAEKSARGLVENYARRGVLCAKGFLPAGQLLMLLIGAWENEFRSVLRAPEDPSELLDSAAPDFIARSAISAQVVQRMLLRLERTPAGDLILPMKEVEGFCVKATQAMYAAFTKPDEALHQMLHGEIDG